MITMIITISIFILILSGISGFFLLEPEFVMPNLFIVIFSVAVLISAWLQIEVIKPSRGKKIFVVILLVVLSTIIWLKFPSLDESEKRAVLLIFFEFCTATAPLLFR